MSKLTCTCGHLIIDQADSLPYKGSILRDQDHGVVFDEPFAAIGRVAEALRSGDRAAIARELPRPQEREDVEMALWARFHTAWSRHRLDVLECTACGRLWVQREPGINRYVSYLPEDSSAEGVLASTGAAARRR